MFTVTMIPNYVTGESSTVVFDDYKEAAEYLLFWWKACYEEVEDDHNLRESRCYNEQEYAVIEWFDGTKLEFHLGTTMKPLPTFKQYKVLNAR